MMVVRYPSLANDVFRVRNAVDRLFDESVFRTIATTQRSQGTYSVPVDVFATADDVVIIASVPGLGPDDLEVTVDENVVTLSGSVPNVARSTEGEGATWYLHEVGHGQFRRSLTLPVDVDADAADATFENGILRLRLPKAEAARPRQIKVRMAEPVSVAAQSESTEAEPVTS